MISKAFAILFAKALLYYGCRLFLIGIFIKIAIVW